MTTSGARLRTAPTADLSPAELSCVRALLDDAFAGRFGDDDWSHALGGVHVLAAVDGDIVGHGSVVLRQLVAGERTLRTGYVEAVATAASWRRRGVGSAVMAEVERLVAGGFELGALSSSRQGVRFYAARGWQRWTGAVAARHPAGRRRQPRRGGVRAADAAHPRRAGHLRPAGLRLAARRPVVRPARAGARAGRPARRRVRCPRCP
ncbi:Aminoglycoside 2'-N-acetyltransferase (modular protein) [Modestobacter italicus]|uniref:Aminoglycoside 2'-N-acetyltransferase (Modular protein) n=1 Tax=Modestobacter italicus (strain DSM 44449 / CECT 9708 / BC 501) TaxID=2732864 RepID=I4F4L2_MODI5|nr:GNAT family N-acetyltransferase [Modestobacter marinus]CCH90575.1 Aminoglycoside 2'-N-acetyltransferase (modular protein) [Modestobacter marinus]